MKNKKSNSAAAQARALVLAGTMMAGSLFAGNLDKESMSTNQGLCFTENKGQISDQNYKARPDILFSGTDGSMDFYLRNNGISYQFSKVKSWKTETIKGEEVQLEDEIDVYRLDVNLIGANQNTKVFGNVQLPGERNYYLAVCPQGATGVHSYETVNYSSVYSGIDLKWYSKEGHLKYDYYVAGGADYKQIRLEINGADLIAINEKGELVITTPNGNLTEQAPLVMQDGKVLKSSWEISNNVVSFHIEGQNPDRPMVIDPFVRAWGTYYGGTQRDHATAIEPFSTDRVYVAGYTQSTTLIATSGQGRNPVYGGTYDAFVAQFSDAGAFVWGTYFGGANADFGFNLKVDATGFIYLVGKTQSDGLTYPLVHINAGTGNTANSDGFIAKFWSTGGIANNNQQIFVKYFGSTDDDEVMDLVLAGGFVYVVGHSYYPGSNNNDISTPGSMQEVMRGFADGFIACFNSNLVRQWGTFYGGSDLDYITGITYDGLNRLYICGYTSSADYMSSKFIHQKFLQGNTDAFLAKFTTLGFRDWGTYFGGSNDEYGYFDVETDGISSIYLVGSTHSTNLIATAGAHQTTFGGGYTDGFLTKFDNTGYQVWGTYYGGSLVDNVFGIDISATGRIFLTGLSQSSTGISLPGDYQSVFGGGPTDAYVAKFYPNGVLYSATYYGGSSAENTAGYQTDLTISSTGFVYICGSTMSPNNMASPGCYRSTLAGGEDVFIAKFYDPAEGIERIAPITNSFPGMEAPQLTVAPNPSNGQFQISFDAAVEGDYVLEITNTLGQVVASEQLNGFSGNYQQNFDLSVYERGMYHVRLRSANGESVLKVITY